MADERNGASPPDDARARLREKLDAVRQRFLGAFDQRVSDLMALALTAAGGGADAPPARDALVRGLHNLSGSAPTIGLVALGHRARELEKELIRAGEAGAPVEFSFAERVASLAAIAAETPQ